MQVHGIILVEGDYNPEETISIAGADISKLAHGTVGWLDNNIDHLLGYIVDVRKVMGPKDCFQDSDWALLDVAEGRPFVRASARLTTSPLLPLIEEIGLQYVSWSASGYVLERVGSHITSSVLKQVFLAPLQGGDPGAYRLFRGLG